jgi:response regulator RpfG family c-di-GMP phosphodiesterase
MPHERSRPAWNILLVDDEDDVIEVSRMVLEDLVFEDRPLRILTAKSGVEAREIFARETDIALAFVDVVMETEHAGLELVKYVRETLRNDRTRLILRTGNPGAAPQGDVVRYLEIDDYKEKTDLTADRLGTSVLTSLRGYRNLMAHIRVQQGLQAIIDSTDPAADEGEVTPERWVAQCAAMAAQTLGEAGRHGLVLRVGRGGPVLVGGFGHWSDAVQLAAVPAGLLAALEVDAGGTGRGTQSPVVVDGGLLLGDRPHPDHAHFLWLEGTDLKIPADPLKVLQLFLGHRAGAMARSALQRELIVAQTEVLFRLCEAVESRSKETGAHIRRIAKYARALAERLGLPAEVQRMIERAAPMHDIGKVAIPDAILEKPGPLDATEWVVMRSHAELGHRLLSHPEFPVMQAAAEVAYHHHERWDGTGYPQGLAGEAIPLVGRIVALVDVFDALLSRRAYKEAWPLPQVVEELRRLRGTHLDPTLVDLLLADIDHFHAIFLDHPDGRPAPTPSAVAATGDAWVA